MKKSQSVNLLTLHIITSSLLFFSCDLFTGPKVDLLKKINKEAEWANAARLSVRIDYPGEWGTSSPSPGTLSMDIRRGYRFNVEFTSLPGYGFEQWLAIPTSEYNSLDKSQSANQITSLNGKGVTITEDISVTGARTAAVTITTSTPITLVPWCSNRLTIIRSNPPLIPALNLLPYDQKISLWFNREVDMTTIWDPETKEIGENIRIKGVGTSGANNGSPVRGEDGDITDCFRVLSYESINNGQFLLVLSPKEEEAAILKTLSISVEIGQGIRSSAGLGGLGMADAQSISYLTNASRAQNVYEAHNIRARRSSGGNYFFDIGTNWNDPDIDRRFNTNDKKTVTISFTVMNPEGEAAIPNRVTIRERMFADLGGFTDINDIASLPYTDNSGDTHHFTLGETYIIEHELLTHRSGIIRLLVLPWLAGGGYTEQDPNTAIDAGQYVTIVIDDAAPALNDLGVSITGGVQNSQGVYNFAQNANLTLTMNRLEYLSDNGNQGGIPARDAFNKPWTMDDRRDLQWRLAIPGAAIDSDWRNVEENGVLNNVFGPVSLSGLDGTRQYTVEAEFRDRMGNVSKTAAAAIQIVAGAPVPVTGLSAQCNGPGNQITVDWITPANPDANMQGAELYVNGRREAAVPGTGEKSQSFSVATINSSGVRDGRTVSNVTRYDISVIGYNTTGPAAAQELTIWNFPDMSVSDSNKAKEIKTAAELAAAASTGQYILANDIDVSDHEPIDNFTGKFYGAGHTITISGDLGGAAHTGLFGNVQNATIRDLTVQYSGTVTANAVHIGGIAGYAGGLTKFINCTVRGGSLVTASNSAQFIGGIAGQMESGVVITNAYSSLNVEVRNNCANAIHAGGIAGKIGVGTNDTVAGLDSRDTIQADAIILSDITVMGNVYCVNQNSSAASKIYAGGIVGLSRSNGGKMQNISYGGTLTAYRNSVSMASLGGNLYAGGIAGYCDYPRLENGLFERSGRIEITNDNSYFVNTGGIVGSLIHNGLISGCTARGDMDIQSKAFTLNGGGITGYLQGIDNANRIKMEKCVYEQGYIFIKRWASNIYTYIGGVIGNAAVNDNDGSSVSSGGDIKDCQSRAALIDVDSSMDYLYFGGFFGFSRVTNIENCGNSSPIRVSDTGQRNTNIYMGGFGGCYGTTPGKTNTNGETLKNCWSVGSVSVKSSGLMFVIGGLIGYSNGGAGINEIYQCWAESNITANYGLFTTLPIPFYDYTGVGGLVGNACKTNILNSKASGTVILKQDIPISITVPAGGLVGSIYNYVDISNCYAAGDVSVDNPHNTTGGLYAGGLVGYIHSTPATIEYCYTSGSVTAQTGGTGAVYAGGIVGQARGTIRYNAARGVNVTAKNESIANNRVAARVYGNHPSPTSPTGNVTGNFAFSSMQIINGAGYYSFPAYVESSSTDSTSPDGESKSNFGMPTIWTNTPDHATTRGLGFNNSINSPDGTWIIQTYPRLAWE